MRLAPAAVSLLAVPLLAVAGPRRAAAEINMADSIEWMTADAELVVRGKIQTFTPHLTAVAGSSPRTYRSSVDLTIAVAEGIRGADGLGASLPLALPDRPYLPAAFEKGEVELLFFLELDERTGRYEPRRGEWVVAIDGATVTPVYTAGFLALRTRKDILAAVHAAATSKATTSHRLDVPWGTPAAEALYAGSAVWMTVPVDAALETLAIGWIAQKDLGTREEGARALLHFHTDANVRRLRALLADPDFATVTETGKPTLRRYLVRKAADEVLTVWGVAHPRPVVDEPLPARPAGVSPSK
jgi:hypothetical protein